MGSREAKVAKGEEAGKGKGAGRGKEGRRTETKREKEEAEQKAVQLRSSRGRGLAAFRAGPSGREDVRLRDSAIVAATQEAKNARPCAVRVQAPPDTLAVAHRRSDRAREDVAAARVVIARMETDVADAGVPLAVSEAALTRVEAKAARAA